MPLHGVVAVPFILHMGEIMRNMLMVAVASVAMWLGFAAIAAACPYITTGIQGYSVNTTQLARPAYIDVVAGGNNNLSSCSAPGHGYVISQPDFSIYYDRNTNGRALEFRTSGNCDTVLLVNAATASWYFDDDGGNGLNGRIRLSNAPGGRYDVWVGTYGPGTCRTQLVVETFR